MDVQLIYSTGFQKARVGLARCGHLRPCGVLCTRMLPESFNKVLAHRPELPLRRGLTGCLSVSIHPGASG